MMAAVRAALNAASKRRSSEITATFASLRSRSTIVSRLLISSRLVGSALSQLYSTHFSKLIFVSNWENVLATHDRIQEMISAPGLRLEFGHRLDGGVDSRRERRLDISETRYHVFGRHLADD